MKILILSLVASLASIQAFADYTYDTQSGNTYNTMGNTTYGNNIQTGSSWTTTNTTTGAYGTDSKGNTWNYDKNTGNYSNSNGTVCTGKGSARVCY